MAPELQRIAFTDDMHLTTSPKHVNSSVGHIADVCKALVKEGITWREIACAADVISTFAFAKANKEAKRDSPL